MLSVLWYRCRFAAAKMQAPPAAARPLQGITIGPEAARSAGGIELFMGPLLRCAAVLLAASVCAAQAVPGTAPASPSPKAAKAGKSAARKPAKKSRPAPAAELPPPPPPRPEQLPPTRPTVSYRNGKLSIVANNSLLSEVLNAVRAQTGAQVEMSGGAGAERVYAKLGPGAPKDVLDALLEGTRFNYAILGSPTDPLAVQRILLMPRPAGGASSPVMATAPQPAQPAFNPHEEEIEEGEQMIPAEEEPPPAEQQQQQPQPGQPAQPQQQPGQPQVKTPEQLLQELQQLQQQQQQQQQQQPQQQPEQPVPDREIPD